MGGAMTARPRRLSAGALVAAVGAILLLVSLFLEWFDPGVTAWTVFEIVDLVLAAAALAALLAFASSFGVRAPVDDRVLLPLGATAAVLVVAALLNHPPAALGADPRAGAWLGLAGGLLMLLGGVLSEARVSLTLDVQGRSPRAATPPPPPPAPPQAPERQPTTPLGDAPPPPPR
jgi:hypothetical protein